MSDYMKIDESESLALRAALGMAPEDVRGKVSSRPSARPVVPGLNDVQLAEVTRVGQSGEFIQPHDWENLLPALSPGQELLWVIRKDGDRFRFYLGLKENDDLLKSPEIARQRQQDFQAIVNHFGRRAFPESRLNALNNEQTVGVLDELHQCGGSDVTVVTGVPSPKLVDEGSTFGQRDEARRPYASLNDILEPFIDEDSFTLVFSVSPASRSELEEELRSATDLRSELRPFIEGERTDTKGRQRSETRTRGRSKNESKSAGEQRAIGPRIKQLLVGAATDVEKMKGEADGYEKWTGASVSYQKSSSRNWNHSRTSGSQWSEAETTHWFNAQADLIDEITELKIKHLTQAMGTGAYRSYVAVYSGSEWLGRRIGKTLSATLGGAHSHLRPFQTIHYSGRYADFPLGYCAPAYSLLPDVPLLDTDQACQLMLMPDAELPGLRLKKAVFYGRSQGERSRGERDAKAVKVGNSAFHEPAMSSGVFQPGVPVEVSREDLLSHVLIAGTTGSGKTMRTLDILNRLDSDDFRIIVLETAKKTYRRYLDRGEKPTVYSLGGSTGRRFRLNPFYFDPGTNLKKHVSVLADALNDLLPTEALIGPKLREAVLRCYSRIGWDIESGEFVGDGERRYPTMIEFSRQIEEICSGLGYSDELNANYRGALLGRSRLFIDDLYQDLFLLDGEERFENMFEQDTILELDDLPPSEVNMPAFVTSLVLQRLRAHRERYQRMRSHHADEGLGEARQAEPPYYLVVVEEAHNILHRNLEEKQDARQTGGSSHLLKQVVRLLQEGRGLGIGVMIVDQSPESLADAVRKNTNTKIVHRLVDGGETETIGKALGLPEEDWADLTRLDTGECIVGLKEGGRPIKVSPLHRSRLPKPQRRDWMETSSEPYGKANRLLSKFSRGVGSCRVIEEVAGDLIEMCDGDVPKAGRMLGRWQAWNGEWGGEGRNYRCPATREELWEELASLTFEEGREEQRIRELVALVLKLVSGSGFPNSLQVQRHVLGDEWRRRAWSSLMVVFEAVASEYGYQSDVTTEVREILQRRVRDEKLDADFESEVRWMSSCPEVRELVVRAALGTFQMTLEQPERVSMEQYRPFFDPEILGLEDDILREQTLGEMADDANRRS